MSKKPEPIWERVSGERLAEKQKEYEEFFKSVPPRTEFRLALKEEMSTHHTGYETPAKADFFKWELFTLEMWAKWYQQSEKDVLAKLFQAVHFLKTHYVKSGLNDLPEVQTTNLQKALEAYVQAFPESKEEVIHEFDNIIYRQWDQVDSKYLSKLILGASQRGGFKEGNFKIARKLALPFAEKMRAENPRITGKKIHEEFVAHLSSNFPDEKAPEISTFRLWLKGKRSRIEELPQAEFHFLAVAIEFFSRIESKKANEAIKELALIFFMQYDEVDPSKISAKLNREKELGLSKPKYRSIRPLVKPFVEKFMKDNPNASLLTISNAFHDHLINIGVSVSGGEDCYCNQTFRSWIK